MTPEPVDPDLVPKFTLRSGKQIPAQGMGTFGSDHADAGQVAEAVSTAIDLGYRLIDCASVYGNEPDMGSVLTEAQSRGVRRDELFVVSKVWNDQHGPEQVAKAARQSLRDLKLEQLDAYLVHWPFPNYHAPQAAPEARNPDSRPYIHEEFMETWTAMEKLVDEGLVAHLGTSNVTVPKLKLILRDARIAPEVNEMELHPTMQQGELFQFCKDHDILPVGYSPLGSPNRPERDRTEADLSDMEMPVVVEIAKEMGVHPAAVCLKWAHQRGQVAIPMSLNPRNMAANLRAITQDPLTPQQMHLLRGVERDNRLIKGQVFLWPGSQSWVDLWDVDGTIPGWDGYAS